MIVRLKEQKSHREVDVCHEFQFYDSPIKSDCIGGKKLHTHKFQFYDSPIKR